MKSTTSEHRHMSERVSRLLYTRLTLTILELYGCLKWYEALAFVFIKLLPLRCSAVELGLLKRVGSRPEALTRWQSLPPIMRADSTDEPMAWLCHVEYSSTTRVHLGARTS